MYKQSWARCSSYKLSLLMRTTLLFIAPHLLRKKPYEIYSLLLTLRCCSQKEKKRLTFHLTPPFVIFRNKSCFSCSCLWKHYIQRCLYSFFSHFRFCLLWSTEVNYKVDCLALWLCSVSVLRLISAFWFVCVGRRWILQQYSFKCVLNIWTCPIFYSTIHVLIIWF